MMTTSDEKFVAPSGVAQPVHNMIRVRVAFVRPEQHTIGLNSTATGEDMRLPF